MSFDSIEEVRRLKKLVYPDALRSESWKLLPMTVTLISTVSEDGVPNVAPYGWVTGISTDPWYVAFSSDRGHKTWINVSTTGEFLVNVPDRPLLKKILSSAKSFPPGTNKIEKLKLKTLPALHVRPPRISDCKVHLECRVEFSKEFGECGLVVGRVVSATVDEDLTLGGLKPGFVLNPKRLRLLTYWGPDAKGREIFTTPEGTLKVKS